MLQRMADQTEDDWFTPAQTGGGGERELPWGRGVSPRRVLDFLVKRIGECARDHPRWAGPDQDHRARPIGPHTRDVDQLDRGLEVGHGGHDLGDVASGGTSLESLGRSMDFHGLGEVVGYNDPRTMVVGDAGKDIESCAILLELDVDVGEPLAADFFHQRGPGGTASTLGPALAPRAIWRDRVFAESFREMTNRLGP